MSCQKCAGMGRFSCCCGMDAMVANAMGADLAKGPDSTAVVVGDGKTITAAGKTDGTTATITIPVAIAKTYFGTLAKFFKSVTSITPVREGIAVQLRGFTPQEWNQLMSLNNSMCQFLAELLGGCDGK